MFTSRRGRVAALLAVAGLIAVSAGMQVVRDQQFATDQPSVPMLYVQSPAAVKRLTMSYAGLAADVYWIRAIQHFGGERSATDPKQQNYELLYPLLDIATTLDPQFNIAYRFGAIFLSEDAPGGPGRPDQAIALLQKGIAANPDKWQYYEDLGFVEYFARRDYPAAAEWFRKGSLVKGAPWWLKPLAASTLAQGGDRRTARALYEILAQSNENDFMQKDARRKLRQLDAVELRDAVQARIEDYKLRGGTAPFTWQRLAAARVVPGVPLDPDGFPFELVPETGEVRVNERSTLMPLSREFAAKPVVPQK
jgi:hypothetical protein